MKTIKIFSSLLLGLLTPLVVIHANWTTGISEAGTLDLPNADIYDIVVNLLLWLLMMFTVLAILAFVIAGIMFLTAGASADNAEKAKHMVGYSILGIVIGLSGYIIISLIDGVLMGYI
jgi:heme/copper-type cytochrome/quinol oxidase subunit 2